MFQGMTKDCKATSSLPTKMLNYKKLDVAATRIMLTTINSGSPPCFWINLLSFLSSKIHDIAHTEIHILVFYEYQKNLKIVQICSVKMGQYPRRQLK